MSLKDRAKQLKREVPAVFLAIKHKETPWYAKVVAFIVVAYALSPVDLIPDFIPILGYLDDILILPVLLALAIRWIPDNIMEECRMKAENMWQNGKPKKWYYALPIVIVWLLLLWLIVKVIWL